MDCGKIIVSSFILILIIVAVAQGQQPDRSNDKVIKKIEIYPINEDKSKAKYGSNINDYKIDIYINKSILKNGTVTITVHPIATDEDPIYTKEIQWSGEYPLSDTISMKDQMDQDRPYIGKMATDIEIGAAKKTVLKPVIDYNIKDRAVTPEGSKMNYTYQVRTSEDIDFYLILVRPGQPIITLGENSEYYISQDINDVDLKFQPRT
jgi:hypothetical protein